MAGAAHLLTKGAQNCARSPGTRKSPAEAVGPFTDCTRSARMHGLAGLRLASGRVRDNVAELAGACGTCLSAPCKTHSLPTACCAGCAATLTWRPTCESTGRIGRGLALMRSASPTSSAIAPTCACTRAGAPRSTSAPMPPASGNFFARFTPSAPRCAAIWLGVRRPVRANCWPRAPALPTHRPEPAFGSVGLGRFYWPGRSPIRALGTSVRRHGHVFAGSDQFDDAVKLFF